MNDWTDAETRVERARELYEKGRWVEAAAELRAAIEVNPGNADWFFNLALTLDAMEEYDRACDAYNAALELEPDDVETLNCLGVDLTRLNRCHESLAIFERIERIDPNYEGSYCNRIVTYTELGDHEQAELMFYMARQVKATCPICSYNIGNSFQERGLHDKAIQCYQQALKLDNEHPDANASLAESYRAKGQLEQARTHYLNELRLDPGNTDVMLDLGELLVELKEFQEASEKFRRVLEQSPEHAGAHYCLGELALRQEKLATAEEQFRLVLRIDATYGGAHARLAQVLLRTGRGKHAVKHLLAELKSCNDDPVMLQELGQLLIDARHTNRANYVLQRLVKIAPQDPHAHHNLAVSYFMLDQLDDGIRHCRKAIKLRPEYSLALYNLALAHLQRGQLPRARRYAARALAIAPRDSQIQRLSRRLGLTGFWNKLRDRLKWTWRKV